MLVLRQLCHVLIFASVFQEFYSGGRLYVGGKEAKEWVPTDVLPDINMVVECRSDKYHEVATPLVFSVRVFPGSSDVLIAGCSSSLALGTSHPRQPQFVDTHAFACWSARK